MHKIFPVLASATILLAIPSCRDNSGTTSDTTPATEQTESARIIPADPDGTVHELTDPDLYSPDARVAGLTLLYFNAVWSGPCRQLGPVFDEMAKQYKDKATFVSVDTDTYGDLMTSYGLGDELPVVLILRPNGKSEHFVGIKDLLPASKFEAVINSNL